MYLSKNSLRIKSCFDEITGKLMASLTLKRGFWYAVFTRNYKQKWVRIGKMSKTAAKEVLRKLEAEHDKSRFGIIDEKQISLSKYSEEYLRDSKANKAKETLRRDSISIKNLLRHFKNINLNNLSSRHIEQFKIKRLEEVSPRTVNIELSCLSHMLNKAVEWKYIRESPFKGVKLLKYDKKPPRFLTKKEVRKLLECSSPWLTPIITVMLNTGIRDGERRNLKFDDIDFDNKIVLVRASKTRDFREIPMHEEVEETLRWLRKNYISPNSDKVVVRKEHQKEYVFCNDDGSPVLRITKTFSNACKKAGLKGVTPHTLRHTFASQMVMSGNDLVTVKQFLGHSNIATTMIYSHLTQDHLKKAIEKLKW